MRDGGGGEQRRGGEKGGMKGGEEREIRGFATGLHEDRGHMELWTSTCMTSHIRTCNTSPTVKRTVGKARRIQCHVEMSSAEASHNPQILREVADDQLGRRGVA